MQRHIVLGLMCLGLAVPCSGQTPHVAASNDSDRTVILTDPPGAIIIVGAETLKTMSPVVARYRRERGDGAQPFRIRALPVDPDGCPQFVRIQPKEPTPDTVHFVMNHCPLTDQDVAGKIFKPDSVDEPPERLRGPMPDPGYLTSSRKPGCVMVGVIIDTTGVPEAGSLQIVWATDSGFIPSATKAVLGSVFRPARVYDRKVRVRVQMPIGYGYEGNGPDCVKR